MDTPDTIPYPHIARNGNGEAVIAGTRTSVKRIAGYYKLGMNAEEICDALTHLSPAEVHAALAYYFDYREEIEQFIEQERAALQQLEREQLRRAVEAA